MQNPRAIGDAIEVGGKCTPIVFFERASRRMQNLVQLNTLPHLSHLRNITLESTNMAKIVGALDSLIKANQDFAIAFIQSKTPPLCMSALTRAAERANLLPSAGIQRQYLESLVRSACQVARWVQLRPELAVRTAMEMLPSGVFKLLRHCSFLPDTANPYYMHQSHKNQFLGLIMSWLANPRIITQVQKVLTKEMLPILPGLPLFSEFRTGIQYSFEIANAFYRYDDRNHRLQVCDNMKHTARGRGGGRIGANSYRACSGCRRVVYCSTACQMEDWEAYHRAECALRRSEILDSGYPKLRYSHNSRTFQTTVLRRVFHNNVVSYACGGSLPETGPKLVMTTDPSDLEDPVTYDTIPEYVAATTPLIPGHLMKRFKDLVGTFLRSERKFGLVNGSFRYGDMEVNLVVLFRRSRLDLYPGDVHNSFDVQASMVYFCRYRDRFAIHGGLLAHKQRNSRVLLL
ncbi:hypothetical protein NMY22_g4707 [Coprinellus aureogranulatus]|nr:hypothetical protein NMY22_g4707 [Coprinellus aureogranulatus]